MIEPGSLVGFAFVFVLVAWTLSSVAVLAQRWCRPRLHGRPALERATVVLATFVPVGLGLGVAALLLARSLLGADHCLTHDHRAHLCLRHGAPWARDPVALAVVVLAATIAGARLARLGVTTMRRRRTLHRLRRASRVANGLRWLDTARAVCFVTGGRHPEIFVSTGAWAALDPDERAAMLAHERAHVRNRDISWRLGLDAGLAFAAPFASGLRRSWDTATERLCDDAAARELGNPEAVASAMVKLARLAAAPAGLEACFTPAADALTDRVEAVLAGLPTGARATRGLVVLISAASLAALLAVAVHAEALHDLLEDLLG